MIAKRIADRDDLRIPMTLSEFLAQAWKLANARARELGWLEANGSVEYLFADHVDHTNAFAPKQG